MVDRRDQQTTQFVALVSLAMRFEANTSKFFADFVVFTDCSDVKMSRSGDFCADRQQMTDKTDCFTPHACARGN